MLFRSYPQYGEYQLPGGHNYEEHILTLKRPKSSLYATDIPIGGNPYNTKRGFVVQKGKHEKIFDNRKEAEAYHESIKEPEYKTRHWEEKNPLVHFRTNEREDANGNKVYFVEELQSDWGQEGREHGFNKDVKPFQPTVGEKERENLVAAIKMKLKTSLCSKD